MPFPFGRGLGRTRDIEGAARPQLTGRASPTCPLRPPSRPGAVRTTRPPSVRLSSAPARRLLREGGGLNQPLAGTVPRRPASLREPLRGSAGRRGTVPTGAGSSQAGDWVALGAQCSALERRADKASWAVIESMKLDFLADKVGEKLAGTVTGVTEFGLFVELDDYNVSGLVHISQLGNDYFVYESDRKCLRGRKSGEIYVLGQSLPVRIAAIVSATRKLDLLPASQPPKNANRRKRR